MLVHWILKGVGTGIDIKARAVGPAHSRATEFAVAHPPTG